MTLRRRVALASTVAVAVAVVAASVVVWFVVRGELYSEVDHSLKGEADRAAMVATRDVPFDLKRAKSADLVKLREAAAELRLQPPKIGASPTVVGLAVTASTGAVPGPGTKIIRGVPFLRKGQAVEGGPPGVILAQPELAKAVAGGNVAAGFSEATLSGVHVRVYTRQAASGEAVQAFRSLTEADHTLSRLKWILLAIGLGGVGLAALLGRAVSRNATRPVQRLTETAEHVTHTRDLSKRIPADERDELGRLAASFNTMLAALESSQQAQRQLVADASHELRTPLTSLRTNLELLKDGAVLAPEERQAMLARSVAQIEELSVLVGDLVDLAREETVEEGDDEAQEARLDLIVVDEIRRAERHAPDRRFVSTVTPCLVRGAPERVARAVRNLLDNAIKWGPVDEPVEVTAIDGELHVRDHGPGIAPEDEPFVFDRFYRAAIARGLPGSGLGLAIVRQVAETYGGRAWAEAAEGGGARLCLRLPVVGLVAVPSPAAFLPSS
jgi:two-component system sensor histidine kinase MprB